MDGWRLVADERGVAQTCDLHRAGLTGKDIAVLVRDGDIAPLTRSWFATSPPATREEWHRLATWGLLRAHEGRAVAGHHSALIFENVPTYRADLDRVRLTRRTAGSPRTRAARSLGRTVPESALGEWTVALGLAVVQHGISSGPLSALVAADGALHRGLITPADIDQALGWVRRHPGSAPLKGMLALADGRRESPGETRLAYALHLMNVPVTPQFRVAAPGFAAVVDFKIDGEMVILEFDGQVKYGRDADEADPFGNKRTPQQVVWLEKRREDRIRELGYEVVRVVWSELDDPVALARRIHAAIRRARARHQISA